MCSVIEDVMLEPNTTVNSNLNTICKKCLVEKPSVVLRKIDSYCKTCFLNSTIHKFRAAIGKYRIVKPSDRVLIVYRIGHPVTALLHFIYSGLKLGTHKQLKFQPVILYIQDNPALPVEEHFNICQKLYAELSLYDFPGYVTSLPDFINNFESVPKFIELNNNWENTFKEILVSNNLDGNKVKNYDDFNEIVLRQLIIRMAKQLYCRLVFTDDISTDVAVKMLSNISFGRGSHLSVDVGLIDDRDSEIKIFQPLRYFDLKELAFYNFFNNLEPISIPNQEQDSAETVHKLVTQFVNALQENYPSTVKTVVRTGDKLTCQKTNNICTVCKAPVEVQPELSSSEAQVFSHWISTNPLSASENIKLQNSDVNICYACKKIANLLKS